MKGSSAPDRFVPFKFPLQCTLTRCYQGVPSHGEGFFQSENLLIWKLLEGEVSIRTDGSQILVKKGFWSVIRPGKHHHSFSADAQILSISLRLRSGQLDWAGAAVASFPGQVELEQNARRLARTAGSAFSPAHAPGERFVLGLENTVRLQAAVWSFLARLVSNLRAEGMTFEEVHDRDPRLEKTLEAINGLPLDQAWNRRAIAQKAGVSPSQLDRLWRKSRRVTPHACWENRRLQFARDHLENSNVPIKEISLALGFFHLSQFSSWFRNAVGLSPREFRARRPA